MVTCMSSLFFRNFWLPCPLHSGLKIDENRKESLKSISLDQMYIDLANDQFSLASVLS